MNQPDMNLLTALDVLLAEQSVAGAARRLDLSTSAMSRTLARLRQVTGDPLLVRAGRRMVLTPYAESIRERTRDTVFDALGILQPDTRVLDPATLQRTFTLRANDGFVDVFAASLIARVAALAPNVRLCFVPKPEKSADALRDGRVDLDIGVVGNMGPEIRVKALFRDRFVGVVRKGHPLARGQGVTVAQYVQWGHIVASRSGRPAGPVDEVLHGLGLERHVAATVPSFPAALSVARASDLIALVPASFLIRERDDDATAALWVFELPVKTDGITISQMWHPRQQMDAAHRWLRGQVEDVCRNEVMEGGLKDG
ncbi:LysR family transcriptional regulator [Marinobacter bohaiensis]|uniref:LysR family transcriptional regulator n=1 Tax=Marinobacter bohaiensis TaxID=2201898 RepID=UPI000DAD36CB|nr:LysR family transcriptional regulator [Marinobacter bohaiensis]